MHTEKELIRWVEPDTDFEELYESSKFQELCVLAKENVNLLVSLFQNLRMEELQKSLSFAIATLCYFEDNIRKDDRLAAVFDIGKLAGCAEALDKIQYSQERKRMAYERATLHRIKHLDDIISILDTNGSLTQSQIGDYLGLQASTLSELMKKVRQTQLVQAVPSGKFLVYSLTDAGHQYSFQLKRHQLFSIQTISKMLAEYLRNPSTRDICRQLVVDELSETQDVLLSPNTSVTVFDEREGKKTRYDINQIFHIGGENTENIPVLVGKSSRFHVSELLSNVKNQVVA